MTQVSCYSLPDAEELADVLDEALRDDPSIQMLGPVRLAGCDAALFVQLPVPREPSWARRLRQSFPDLPNLVGGGSGAVLAVKLDDAAGLLALTFGSSGRFMLDPSAWERGFGTKTALNIIFQGDDGTLDDYASRIQSIDSTRLESTRLQTRQQASNTSPFELFGVDILRDVLRGLVGTPWDIEVWRGRIGGGDGTASRLYAESGRARHAGPHSSWSEARGRTTGAASHGLTTSDRCAIRPSALN